MPKVVDERNPPQPEVQEEFVGFIELESTTVDCIAKEILGLCSLDIRNLRGLGYDGASVMAGKVSGVSTQSSPQPCIVTVGAIVLLV